MIRRVCCALAALAAFSSSPAQEPPMQVVTITGNYSGPLRDYRHLLPGIREHQQFRFLAPQSELRFGMVTSGFPTKPLPVSKAELRASGDWSEPVKVVDDGWMLIQDSEVAAQLKAKLVVSRRTASREAWMIEVYTPDLPPRTYRLGDLRLECRVYLAIEWHSSGGTRLLGDRLGGRLNGPPMDYFCNSDGPVYLHPRPWPRLQTIIFKHGERTARIELDRFPFISEHLMLQPPKDKEVAPWPDDTLVEFVFYDNSHWGQATGAGKSGAK